jgi:hypothetical protein
MKLAEALILRSDRKKMFDSLRARAASVARYQEGEQPPEDAEALLAQADEVLTELEDLIRRINRTNSSATIADGRTITEALAERDILKLRHSILSGVADAASGTTQMQFQRQMRSELRFVPAVDVSEVRDRADDIAKRHRELDSRIQEANWGVDLIEN